MIDEPGLAATTMRKAPVDAALRWEGDRVCLFLCLFFALLVTAVNTPDQAGTGQTYVRRLEHATASNCVTAPHRLASCSCPVHRWLP